MIVWDTETTGLIAPEAAPIEQQPRMLEFAAIKLNSKLEERGRLQFLINPHPVVVTPEISKYSNITQEMVANQPPFVARYAELCEFFGGQRVIVAHNLSFDIRVLYYELLRIGKVCAFPWPPRQLCTVEATVHLKGYRLKLGDLHQELTGIEHSEGVHRAMGDTEALVRCLRVMYVKRMP